MQPLDVLLLFLVSFNMKSSRQIGLHLFCFFALQVLSCRQQQSHNSTQKNVSSEAFNVSHMVSYKDFTPANPV